MMKRTKSVSSGREFLKKLLPSKSAKSSGPLRTGLEKLIVLYDVMHGVRVNC
ncbi:MAG: hypothetical protein QG577_1639 [Thermodesulfobacteriota bacterium]|nr:hypothetical protein [Thermodesulfobacteriota bacterium]